MKYKRIKKLTALKETKYLSLYNARFINKKGDEGDWIIASRKDFRKLKKELIDGNQGKSDAVLIGAFHNEIKKLVLIKQFRVPINDYIIELPAGLIDEDEDVKEAVIRELKEETGLIMEDFLRDKSKSKLYLSPGMTDESADLCYCTCSGLISNKYQEVNEDIEVILVSREEAKELIKQDIKFNVKAYLIIQSFINLGENMFE